MAQDHQLLSPNTRLNSMIHLCFEYISMEDKQRFVLEFRRLSPASSQILHTFRELVLGAYLASTGIAVRYQSRIEGRTPDWSLLKDGRLAGYVDLINFHIDRKTETQIEEQHQARRVAAYWRDENKDNAARLYQALQKKAQHYSQLAAVTGLPWAIALFPEFLSAVDFADDVLPSLVNPDSGIFPSYPSVSGLLYFEEASGTYFFNYTPNPVARISLILRSGEFPTRAA